MIKIQVFAVLKEYFEEQFEIQDEIRSVAELKQTLLKRNPKAGPLLETCRFAVNNSFIDEQFTIKEYETVYLIPPSGGG